MILSDFFATWIRIRIIDTDPGGQNDAIRPDPDPNPRSGKPTGSKLVIRRLVFPRHALHT